MRKPYPRDRRMAVETEIGFIYVAKYTRRRLIKIGFSLNPEKRMRFLFKKDIPGRLIAKMPGTVQQERALHRTLREHHLGWEQYHPSILNHPAIPAELRSAA